MKKALIIVAVLLVVITGLVLDTVRDAGQFKELAFHSKGKCREISGIIGPEDITVDPGKGLAYISSDDRRATLRGEPRQGAIYSYDLGSEDAVPIHLTRDFEKDFHPHGISLYFGENGRERLFVVNHGRRGDSVEIFAVGERHLVHQESISGDLMHSPNDLVAVGERSFYVTNDHGNTSDWGRTLEEYLRLARANVLFYDGGKFRVVAEKLLYANGINVSADGKEVYVAATTGGQIRVYARDPFSGSLTFQYDIGLKTGVDNLELDPNGNLWVAAHPKLLTFVKHAKDSSKTSPSQVVKVHLTGNNEYSVEEIYLDDGKQISGSSVASVFGQELLIGAVFGNKFLRCNLNESP